MSLNYSLMRNVSYKICNENFKAHYMSNNFFPKIMPLLNNMEEYGRVREAIDHNMTRRVRFA
jgi:hypothetical protein